LLFALLAAVFEGGKDEFQDQRREDDEGDRKHEEE
jgi:hypothetical protein